MAKRYIGGSFAPPLTDELLAGYRTLIDAQPPQTLLRDALEHLYRCVMQWWELPESKRKGKRHPVGVGFIVDLEEDHAKALWEAIPWDHELDAMARLFEAIDPKGERALRNAAHHLLWHVKELNLDREPLTNDKL